MTAPAVRALRCPYVGLDPFSEADARFFFGRERDRETIISNLIASRLTLLYGTSGVGKSSVLRAGVVLRLRELARRNLDETGSPEFLPVYVKSWKDDPVLEVLNAVRAAAASEWGGGRELPAPSNATLVETLGEWAATLGCTFLIILDQFEEYFLYHPAEDGPGSFAHQFPIAAVTQDLPANFLLSIRDDALAKVDVFKRRLPKLFDNRLSIGYLNRKDAARAITEPLREFNREYSVAEGRLHEVENAVVEEVLDQVALETDRDAVQTPYLQLVMTRLWEAESEAGSARLRAATLTELGGPRSIVKHHLRSAMETLSEAERDIAAVVFRYLVTPSRTKIALSLDDLAGYAAADIPAFSWVDIPRDDIPGYLRRNLGPLFEKLSSKDFRLLRPVPSLGTDESRYEICHDVLAGSILEWRTRYISDQQAGVRIAQEREAAEARLAEEQRQAAERLAQEHQRAETEARFRRRLRRRVWALAGVSILAALAAGYAGRMFVRAHARGLTFAAASQLPKDPELAALLLLHAAPRVGQARDAQLSADADDLLQRALLTLRVRETFPIGGPLAGVAFRPDGRVMTVVSDSEGKVTAWDARSRREIPLRTFFEHVQAVAFSDDAARIAVAAGGLVHVWDLAGGGATGPFACGLEPGGWISGIGWSPDGKQLAVSGMASVTLCDASSGQSRPLPPAHGAEVTAAGYSHDGQFVAVARKDRTISILDARSGRVAVQISTVGEPLGGVAFSPDGRLVAAGLAGGDVEVWEVRQKRNLYTLRGHTNTVFEVSFDRTGDLIATGGADATVRVWDGHSGRALFTLSGHSLPVAGLQFNSDGALLASASWDGTVRLWSASVDHNEPIDTVAVSSDGRRVATGGDGMAKVWDLRSGTPVLNRRLPLRGTAGSDDVSNIAFSPDGKLLATASNDKVLRIWALDDPQRMVQIPDAHEGLITGVCFAAAGSALVTSGTDGLVRWWDPRTGAALPPRFGPARWIVEDIACGDGGRLVAVAYGDRTVKLLDGGAGTEIRELPEVPKQHASRITSLGFSPDGKLLATSSYDATVKVWDAASGQLLQTLTGHQNIVFRPAFSPNGQWIATSSLDHTVRIWDAATGRQLRVLTQNAAVYAAVFSPDGRLLAIGGVDKTLHIVPLDRDELLALAKSRVTRSLTSAECERFLETESCPALP